MISGSNPLFTPRPEGPVPVDFPSTFTNDFLPK